MTADLWEAQGALVGYEKQCPSFPEGFGVQVPGLSVQ